jgi:hypothetical protein
MQELATGVAPLTFRLFGVEGLTASGERCFYRSSPFDKAVESEAVALAEDTEVWRYLHSKTIPTNGRRDARPVSHGFKSYGDLFFPRQVLGLQALSDSLVWSDLTSQQATVGLLLISDTAGNNSRLCSYAADWFKQSPSFGIHAYRPPTRPVEGNFVGAPLGRGSFTAVAKKAGRAYAAIRQSLPEGRRTVFCGPASAMAASIKQDADLVIYTDPPYFDFLDYADLSDFFYQIHLAARKESRADRPDNVHSEADISLMATRRDASQSFGVALAESLKPFVGALRFKVAVLHFHHSSIAGWEELAAAIRMAGLTVDHIGFERSEYENGFHSYPGNAKLDALFYLVADKEISTFKWPTLNSEIRRAASSVAALRDADVSVVAGALSVVHASRAGYDQRRAYGRLLRGLTRRSPNTREFTTQPAQSTSARDTAPVGSAGATTN